MLIPNRLRLLLIPSVLFLCQSTYAQPPTDPVPPEIAPYNVDGSTVWPMLNSLDPRAWLDGYAAAIQFQETLIASTPIAPANLAATVSGVEVLLTWTLPTPSATRTRILVERNPAWSTSPTIVGTATGLSDTPGSGTFQYRASAVQVIGTRVYPSVWTPWVQVTVQGPPPPPPPPSVGWTDLTPPAGSAVIYVSASSGNDTSTGTQTAPLKSLAAGYAKLRDGFPDQLLLKCGDTWGEWLNITKGSGSTTTYMVVGSYGTGPRPKLRPPTGEVAFNFGTRDKKGVAIVDIDAEPAVRGGSNTCAVMILGHWSHVLIEGCSFIGWPGNIVIQDIEQTHITMDDIRIRRNVIADSYDTGGGHSQGIFFRDCSNWVMEGNILDNNARNKADIFCHNVYVNEGCGAGAFNDNISARACSHGVQQRPGGYMDGNLFLANPINAYQGKSAYVPVSTNYFRYNVVLDSRDINASNPRAIGVELGDADTIICENNVIAHQKVANGLYSTYALALEPINAGSIRGNAIYAWGGNPQRCEAVGIGFYNGGAGAVTISGNKVWMTAQGQVISHQTSWSSRFTYSNNKYFSTNAASGCFYSAFDVASGSGGDFAFWQARTGDTGSTYAAPPTIDATINAYMASIGTPGDLDAFMAEARKQSKQNWRAAYTPAVVNAWVRAKFGVANP